MEIDVRKDLKEKITKIRFADVDVIDQDCWSETCEALRISTNNGDDNAFVYLKDIDNLIKALEKAKEVFGIKGCEKGCE